MAIPFTPATGSASISGTEFSLPNGSTTLTPQTTACKLEAWIDASAVLAGDQYRVQIMEKVNGGTQAVAWEGFLTGATPQLYVLPVREVNEGWDVRVKLISGSARTIAWALKEDVGDRNALTIATGAIAAATFAAGAITSTVLAAGAITSTVIAAAAISASQLASAAITAAKFAADAIDANALSAGAVAELQAGLATSSALASVQTDTTTLTGRLTSTRAGLIDNLDAAVTTRAAASTAVSNADLTSLRAAKLDNLDAAVTTCASSTAVADIQTRLPAALDGSGNIKAGVQSLIGGALDTITAAIFAFVEEAGAPAGARTFLQRLRIKWSLLAGPAVDLAITTTTTEAFRDAADTKDRATFEIDTDGTRTPVVLDGD